MSRQMKSKENLLLHHILPRAPTMSECKSFIFTLIICHVYAHRIFHSFPFPLIKHGCCANVEFASMITFFPRLSAVFTRFAPK